MREFPIIKTKVYVDITPTCKDDEVRLADEIVAFVAENVNPVVIDYIPYPFLVRIA